MTRLIQAVPAAAEVAGHSRLRAVGPTHLRLVCVINNPEHGVRDVGQFRTVSPAMPCPSQARGLHLRQGKETGPPLMPAQQASPQPTTGHPKRAVPTPRMLGGQRPTPVGLVRLCQPRAGGDGAWGSRSPP